MPQIGVRHLADLPPDARIGRPEHVETPHTPLVHAFVQHWLAAEHADPSGVQLPPTRPLFTHDPSQHWPLDEL